ncbi:hypothetical protein Tsubulata_035325 [Turnera subulata]|uniref:Homeobox domain-containing protein n=1 Tax=Turnera subulata TaxID=218843 RepID=A0A9Q0FYM0_9ROSI|nr:hypothetical protein Tsubulata_035325 [Turnera subulata]
MATYYQGLSGQGDNFQSLYPGDQKLISFSELPSHLNNTSIYMNPSSSTTSFSEILSVSTLPPQSGAELPSIKARNEMMFIPPTSNTMNLQSGDVQLNQAGNSANGDPQEVPSTQFGIFDGERNFQPQGLSLSLGADVHSATSMPLVQYQSPNLSFPPIAGTHFPIQGKWTLTSDSDENNRSKALGNSDSFSVFSEGNQGAIKTEDSNNPHWLGSNKNMHTNMYVYESSEHANTILSSRFLKAAQELLDEVVNVKHALKQPESKKTLDDSKETDERPTGQSIASASNGISTDTKDSTANSSSDLSPSERQDLQNKKTKLLSMLDEIDGKYRQYHQQMKILVSSFDVVAGHGAAKAYTALALQTISRHFRCLRDAITDQIEATRKRLGEQDNGQTRIPRLRYVDHQVRQQRALQQLGVMRHAWRPQRGLPESSVSVLRAWLFEHFLHPYPNDSEKIMLARKTGLTRNQVANWFINARVRLWKPMVEEMYKEEFCDSEAFSKSSIDNAIKACGDDHLASENRVDELAGCVTSTTADGSHSKQDHDFKSTQIPNLVLKRPRTETALYGAHGDNVTDPGITKFQFDQMSKINDHSLSADGNIPRDQNGSGTHISASVAYGASELSEFAVGSQVSLALGLHGHASDALAMSHGTHITDNSNLAAPLGPEDLGYHHCMESGKENGRFGNSHLFHDFVV